MPSPNPSWKIGDKVISPVSEMITLDPDAVPVADRYKILIGAVVPRPIAFVSTLSQSGKGNLAPFSFFNGVSSNPPCLMFSISRKPDGSKKDTLINIEETGEFVVNSANEWLTEPLVQCSGAYPYGVDEMALVGLTPLKSDKVKPSRVKESAIQFECRYHNRVDIGDESPGSATVIIGEIVQIHIHKPAYQDGKIIISELKPLSRIGGFGYSLLGPTFEIPTPKVGPG